MMINLKSISRSVLFVAGIMLSLTACADNDRQAQSCSVNGVMYFQCVVGSKSFALCDQQPGVLLFVEKDRSSEVFLSGKLGEAFKFENYHRFRVTQNTLSFSIENTDYELFDYVDEEMQPAIHEIGIAIEQRNGSKQEWVCESGSKSSLGQLN